jgi:2-haloalkanoic acid dehalogenase type II
MCGCRLFSNILSFFFLWYTYVFFGTRNTEFKVNVESQGGMKVLSRSEAGTKIALGLSTNPGKVIAGWPTTPILNVQRADNGEPVTHSEALLNIVAPQHHSPQLRWATRWSRSRKSKKDRWRLQPHPDVKDGLETLRSNVIIDSSNGNNMSGGNLKMVVLSNGGKVQTEKLLLNIGLRSYFDEILSAEDVQRYKPDSEPYLNTSKILRVEISEIAMVSSNLLDILGAYSVGMKTCWINRQQQIVNEEIDAKPDYTFHKVGEIEEVFLQGQQER